MCIGGGRGGIFCIRRALSPSYIYLGGGDLSIARNEKAHRPETGAWGIREKRRTVSYEFHVQSMLLSST